MSSIYWSRNRAKSTQPHWYFDEQEEDAHEAQILFGGGPQRTHSDTRRVTNEDAQNAISQSTIIEEDVHEEKEEELQMILDQPL